MKKKLSVLVTTFMLSFTVNAGLVLAETGQPTGVMVEEQNTEVAVEGETLVTETTAVIAATETDSEATTADTTTTDTTTTDTTTATETTDSDAIGTDTVVVDADGQEVDPGTLPDSPLSWLEELIEKIKVTLAGNPIEKAQLLEEQATEDLAEVTELVKEGETNEEQIEEVLTSYTTKVEKALEFLEQVENTDSDEYQKFQEALTKVNTNNVIVLGGLLEKLPAQAAEKVALNIVRAMEKAIAKVEKKDRKLAPLEQVETADTDTAAEGEATMETSADATTAETINDAQVDEEVDEEVNISAEATDVLTTFAKALGLEKSPQGNAYGYYYKHNKEAKEAKEAAKAANKARQVTEQTEQQEEQAEEIQEETQTEQQEEQAEGTQVETQQQVEQTEEIQEQAEVQKEKVKSSSKQNNENNRNHDRGKNGDRNRD
jgi:hypothetical protein